MTTFAEGWVIFLRLPLTELICLVALVLSHFRAKARAKKLENTKWLRLISVSTVRNLCIVFASNYILWWILWFFTRGAIMPTTGKQTDSRALKILYVVPNVIVFGSLPAAGVTWGFFMLNMRKDMASQVPLPDWIPISFYVFFGAITLVRLVFGIQWVDHAHYFDVCFRPFACMVLWGPVGVVCCFVLYEIWMATQRLESRPEASSKQVQLMRKLYVMVFGCACGVVGRAVQITRCTLVPSSSIDRSVHQTLRRFAVISLLTMCTILTWVGSDGNTETERVGMFKNITINRLFSGNQSANASSSALQKPDVSVQMSSQMSSSGMTPDQTATSS